MSGEHDVTLGHLQDTDDKPKYKGRVVIIAALNSSPEKRGTLEEIYSAVKAKFPWYAAEKNAKDRIRMILSNEHIFVLQPRPLTAPGSGGWWTLDLSQTGSKRADRQQAAQAAKAAAAAVAQESRVNDGATTAASLYSQLPASSTTSKTRTRDLKTVVVAKVATASIQFPSIAESLNAQESLPRHSRVHGTSASVAQRRNNVAVASTAATKRSDAEDHLDVDARTSKRRRLESDSSAQCTTIVQQQVNPEISASTSAAHVHGQAPALLSRAPLRVSSAMLDLRYGWDGECETLGRPPSYRQTSATSSPGPRARSLYGQPPMPILLKNLPETKTSIHPPVTPFVPRRRQWGSSSALGLQQLYGRSPESDRIASLSPDAARASALLPPMPIPLDRFDDAWTTSTPSLSPATTRGRWSGKSAAASLPSLSPHTPLAGLVHVTARLSEHQYSPYQATASFSSTSASTPARPGPAAFEESPSTAKAQRTVSGHAIATGEPIHQVMPEEIELERNRLVASPSRHRNRPDLANLLNP